MFILSTIHNRVECRIMTKVVLFIGLFERRYNENNLTAKKKID